MQFELSLDSCLLYWSLVLHRINFDLDCSFCQLPTNLNVMNLFKNPKYIHIGWDIPSSHRMEQNLFSSRSFVKMPSNCLLMCTYISSISPFWTWSLKKWCRISMCFVLEYCIGFLSKFIALVLSQLIGIWSKYKS